MPYRTIPLNFKTDDPLLKFLDSQAKDSSMSKTIIDLLGTHPKFTGESEGVPKDGALAKNSTAFTTTEASSPLDTRLAVQKTSIAPQDAEVVLDDCAFLAQDPKSKDFIYCGSKRIPKTVCRKLSMWFENEGQECTPNKIIRARSKNPVRESFESMEKMTIWKPSAGVGTLIPYEKNWRSNSWQT